MPIGTVLPSAEKERAARVVTRREEFDRAAAEETAASLKGRLAVRVDDVSVEYQCPRERVVSLKEYVLRTLQGRSDHRSNDAVRALDSVSLELRAGEIFGVIGPNGAGKSTLLKVLSRVLPPTRGRVRVWGQVAPLLELGAGFHTELTGRENVFLNGALLGHPRALLAQMFDSIVAFSELGDFIDAPLRTYSSGMFARLAFAVATAVRPDLLLVDETLSVGDARFAEKCLDRIEQFRRSGTTILIVSHSDGLISKWCDRAAWLHGGRLRRVGPAAEVVEMYLRQ
jgi:ABC-type polysaccharide/polyol phosphate transport system ATPase subunit